jgi:predicted RNA-binding Zn-ribbon protein involved in translation (DUF1610 family)
MRNVDKIKLLEEENNQLRGRVINQKKALDNITTAFKETELGAYATMAVLKNLVAAYQEARVKAVDLSGLEALELLQIAAQDAVKMVTAFEEAKAEAEGTAPICPSCGATFFKNIRYCETCRQENGVSISQT